MRGAPRTDPGVRNYRTGLLPWVVTASRCSAAVSAPTPLARGPGPASGPRGLEANCPWPAPFPRPAPLTSRPGDTRQAVRRRRCSQGSAVLWGRLTSRVRSSPSCSRRIYGADRGAITAAAGRGTSQFPCEESTYVHGVFDRAGPFCVSRYRRSRCCLRHKGTASAPRTEGTFAAQWPARTHPYQRLQCVLADAPPWLGAGSGRYCLTVWLSHPLLSASYWRISLLPRRPSRQ